MWEYNIYKCENIINKYVNFVYVYNGKGEQKMIIKMNGNLDVRHAMWVIASH